MSHNIIVEGGKSVRLPTAGKYCDRDIIITAEGGEPGLDTSDATATAANILKDKTAYVKGSKITGSMPNNGAVNATMDGIDTKSITIAAGYTAGGTVSLDDTIDNEVDEQADLIAQIMKKVNSLPEAGSGSAKKTVTVTLETKGLGVMSYIDESGSGIVNMEFAPITVEAMSGIIIYNKTNGDVLEKATGRYTHILNLPSTLIYYFLEDGGTLTFEMDGPPEG